MYIFIFILGSFACFYILNFFDLSSIIYNSGEDINPNQLNNDTPSDLTKTLLGLPDLNILTGHVEGLDKYPLNLLSDMSLINMSAITFLFLMVVYRH